MVTVNFAWPIRLARSKARSLSDPWLPGMHKSSMAQGWQAQAWDVWHRLPEVHYPTTHLARQIGRLKWDVDLDGEQLPEEEAAKVIAAVTRGMGHRDGTTGLAINLQVAGEAWFVERPNGDFGVWSVVSKDLDKKVEEARARGLMAQRVFFPDPVDPSKADCAMRTVLDPAYDLLALSALSRSQSHSRIASVGVVLVNDRMDFPDGFDPFGRNLEDAMLAAIYDVNSPSASTPIKVDIPDELMEGTDRAVKHFTLDRPYDDRLAEKIERATRRVGVGLDIDPGVLTGSEGATHWSAWFTALETYTSHLEPLGDAIGELLARVAEELLARVGLETAVTITPNAGELLAKRSTVRDALDAAKIGAVGLAYVRDAIGAREEDAPTAEELEILRLVPRETGREATVDEGTGEATPAGATPMAASLVALPASSAVSYRMEFPEKRTPEARLLMCAAAVTARRRVGAKVRSAVSGEDRRRIDGVDNSDVVAILGSTCGVDVDPAIWAGLEDFRGIWESELPNAGDPYTAAVRLAMHVRSGLLLPYAPIPEDVAVAVYAGDLGGS